MVYVIDNITPITKQKVEDVTPHKWDTMSVAELLDQRAILSRRIYLSLQSGQAHLAPHIQRGIDAIDALINSKGPDKNDNGLGIT